MLHVPDQLIRRLITPFRQLLGQLQNNIAKSGPQLGRLRRRIREILVDLLHGHGHGSLGREGQLLGGHFIHGDTQRIKIGTGIHLAASGLLGGEIMHRSQGLAGGRHCGLGGRLGDTEIRHLYISGGRHHDILRFDVSVDDSAHVRHLQRLRDLDGDLHHFLRAQHIPAFNVFLQGNAIDVFHDNIVTADLMPQVIDSHNIGMGQAAGRQGFLFKFIQNGLVQGKFLLQNLNCHQAAQFIISGFIDDGHTAGSYFFQDLISSSQHSSCFKHSTLPPP